MKPKIIHIPLPNLYNPEKKNEHIEEPDTDFNAALRLASIYFIMGICTFICALFSGPELQNYLLMGGGLGILMGIIILLLFYKMVD